MATPRRLLVDPENECDYHLVSRCVRRAFLCGVDERTGRDWSHRRGWLLERLRRLARCFAVDVYAYAVLSNHFHLVVRHDPQAWRGWSDAEVARRWYEAFPPIECGEVVEKLKAERRELLLGDPARLARARRTLGSLSAFMKHLKQPIARRANLEDGCGGHFFEQRFYSGALLTEEALVAAMAYVDLNPVRAALAARIEDARDASIHDRLQASSGAAVADYLAPVLSGLEPPAGEPPAAQGADGPEPRRGGEPARSAVVPACAEPRRADAPPAASEDSRGDAETPASQGSEPGGDDPRREPGRPRRRPRPGLTLAAYVELVRGMAEAESVPGAETQGRTKAWLARTKVLRKRQRAHGSELTLRRWLAERGMRLRETPLPA